MSKPKKLTIGLLAGVVFACALFCTTNFAFADENPLQKIQDTLNSLYGGTEIVSQDVYGIVAEDYAVSSTKVEFDGGEDTAIDILKTDGSVKFHTSTADTKSTSDPVWGDYYFVRDNSSVKESYDNVGRFTVGHDGLTPIVKKETGKAGAIDNEGNIVIPCEYSEIGGTGFFYYGVKVTDDTWTYSIYSSDSHTKIQDISTTSGSTSTYISGYGNNYFKIPNGSYYHIEGTTITEKPNISYMNSYYNSDYTEQSVIYSTTGNELYFVNSNQEQCKICDLVANDSFTLEGKLIRISNYYQSYIKYYTINGLEITSVIPEGYTSSTYKNTFQDYTIFTNSTLNKTILVSYEGVIAKTLDGIGMQFNNEYFVVRKQNGENIDFIAYDDSFLAKKTMKTLPASSVSSGCYFYTLSSRWMMPIQVLANYPSYYYFNEEDLTEFASKDSIPDYQLPDGRLVYKYHDEDSTLAKYRDASGNPIVINGYTLATYGVEGDNFASFYANRLQRGNQDIWWAKNSAGKYGAISSIGEVKVPFAYDRIHDQGSTETDYAMGYVNGNWEFIDTTSPLPKPAPVVESTTENSITLSWPTISVATKYAVATQNSDGKTYTTYTDNLTDTTYTITGLKPNTTYKCLVQAYIAGEWSLFTQSDLKVAKTKQHVEPGAPVVDAQATGDGKVTLTWDAIENADKYAAYEVIGDTFKPINENLKVCTVNATNLANCCEHTFLVQAHVGGSWSKYTKENYASATPEGPIKPTLENPKVTGTNIKLTWNKVSGATKYAVATKVGSSKYTTYTLDCTDTTYTIKGLEEGVKYDCLVQAYINGKWSEFDDSDLKQATTKGTRPVVDAEATGDGEVTLSWDAIDGADKYAAYEVVNGSFVAISENIPAGTRTVTKDNLANGYQHTFLVQAHVGGSWSKYSEKNYAYATPTGTIKPTISAAEVTGTNIKLEWNKVPGANRYAVATRTATGGYVTHSYNVTDTEFTISGLEDSTKYYCLVQANINGKWSDFSNADLKEATTKGTRPVVDAEATGDGQVTLSWDAIENADKYVAYEVVNGSFNQIDNFMPSGTTSKVVTDLANGYEHIFLVQAQVDGVWSKFNEGNYAKATPTGTVKPTLNTPEVTGTNIKLTWNKVPGASKYAIATKVGSSGYTTYTLDCVDTTYTIKGLEDGVTYDCLVQANINGNWSAFNSSDLKQATTKGTRPAPQAEAGDGYVKLTWDAIDNATKYVAYEVINGQYVQIGSEITAPTTTVTKDDLVNEQQHTFLVQAYVGGTWSKYSEKNYVSATPHGAVKPTIKTATPTSTTIKVTWDKVSGSDAYNAAITTDGTHFTNYELNKNTFEYTFTGLTRFTTYKVLIQRRVGNTWSLFTSSDLKTVKTEGELGPVAVKSNSSQSNPTLTFYYDKKDHSSEGEVFYVENEERPYMSWYKNNASVKTVNFDSSFANYHPKSCYLWFGYYSENGGTSSVETINNLQYLNTDKITDMGFMFANCANLTSLDLSNFDTSNVKNMNSMFSGCTSLQNLNISNFNTTKVKTMHSMFKDCSSLASLNLSNFNTSNNTTSENLFFNCKALATLTLPNSFVTAKNTSCRNMFAECQALTEVNTNNWDVTNVAQMSAMFYNCKKLASLDLSSFGSSPVQDLSHMFDLCESLTSLDMQNFTGDSVNNIYNLFNHCHNILTLNLKSFNGSNIKNTSKMFMYLTKMETLNLSSFNTSQVTDMSYMFAYCEALKTLSLGSQFKTSNVQTMAFMFIDCASLEAIPAMDQFDTSNVTNMSNMFSTCAAVTSFSFGPKFNTSKVTNMSDMFNTCSSIQSITFPSQFDTRNVTDMMGMFKECLRLKSITFSPNFNTSKVTIMHSMFYWCDSLESLDLSSFDTSNVTNMEEMFSMDYKITTINFGNKFNTSKVTNMRHMFVNCYCLNVEFPSCFNTSNVTTMELMFSACKAVQTLDLSMFDTHKVKEMGGMMSLCESLKTVYVSNSFVTTALPGAQAMFARDTNLKGGSGTTFDTNHIDSTYARIDGGPTSSTPGYFTYKAYSGSAGNISSSSDSVLADTSVISETDDCCCSNDDCLSQPDIAFANTNDLNDNNFKITNQVKFHNAEYKLKQESHTRCSCCYGIYMENCLDRWLHWQRAYHDGTYEHTEYVTTLVSLAYEEDVALV